MKLTFTQSIIIGLLPFFPKSIPLLAPVTVTASLSEAGHPRKQGGAHFPDAVLWLAPLGATGNHNMAWPTHGTYTMLQKNRTFTPHLLVVHVGSVVSFPNADPFFHNVFSLFEGKRFDLGLYESGSSRQVHFDRPGVSYIFCNIHPEMSAVVLALATPLWSIADIKGKFRLKDVPPGEYEVHLWAEGEDPSTLEQWTHSIQIDSTNLDLGTFPVNIRRLPAPHKNMFGEPYTPEPAPY